MEDKEKVEQTENKTNGLLVIGGAFIIGYFVGVSAANRLVNESYHKGVRDTLESIIFKQR